MKFLDILGVIRDIIVMVFVIMIIVNLIKQIKDKKIFNYRKNRLYVGMGESEMLNLCGKPSQTIVIDENCKLIIYEYVEWIGALIKGITHHKVIATFHNNKITNVSHAH